MNALIKELIAVGDYSTALERSIEEYREIPHATIAAWFSECGLPARSINTEIARISACLNPNKKEYFKPIEWWVIQSKSDNYTMYETESQFFGFSRPVELDERDAQKMLQKRREELQAELKITEAMLGGRIQPAQSLRLFSNKNSKA